MSFEELEPDAMGNGDPRLNRILDLLESMDGRMSRLEEQLTELTGPPQVEPSVLTGVTESVDQHVAEASERGVDVDAHVRSSMQLIEALTEPATVATLSRMLDRMDVIEHSVRGVEQLPGLAAGAADTAERLVASAKASGIDLDARFRASVAIAERLTDPATAEALLTVTEYAPQIAQATVALSQVPDLVSGAIDTVDSAIRQLDASGFDLDARFRGVVLAAERFTDPTVLSALITLADKTPQLEEALAIAERLPGMVAAAMDTFDGLAAQVAERGIDVDERLALTLQAAESLTDPVIIHLLQAVLAKGPELTLLVDTLLESGVLEKEAVDLAGSTGRAVVQTRSATPAPVGALGAAFSIFDKDVQRSLGFAIHFAQRFGRTLDAKR